MAAQEQTLSILKPDTTTRNLTGAVNARLEAEGFRIVAQKRVRLTREQAALFYAIHSARPFYEELCDTICAAPVVVQILQRENAIAFYRELLGATDPTKAADGTLRKEFGKSIIANVAHGSDSPETAAFEIGFFFSLIDICE